MEKAIAPGSTIIPDQEKEQNVARPQYNCYTGERLGPDSSYSEANFNMPRAYSEFSGESLEGKPVTLKRGFQTGEIVLVVRPDEVAEIQAQDAGWRVA